MGHNLILQAIRTRCVQGGHFPAHVLYLRELDNYMALVCVMPEETFKKKVVCFRCHLFGVGSKSVISVGGSVDKTLLRF